MAPRKNKQPTTTSALLDAVRFVGLTLKEKGAVNDQFCMIANGWITAFNGVTAMGAPIVQQFMAAPHNKRLHDALAGCGAELSIAQLADDKLHVRSGDFQAFVPCCPANMLRELIQPRPDMPTSAVDDTLKAAIVRAGVLASAKAQSVLCNAVVLNSGSVIATNNTCIIEMWHGFGMRDDIKLPKVAVALLTKIKKKLSGIGFSANTFTFHFVDGSWLKTNLFTEVNPDMRKCLLQQDRVQNATAAPKDFFAVVGKLAKFAYDGRVYCTNDAITAWENAGRETSAEGTYDVPGAPANISFLANDLLEVADLVETIDFRALPGAAMFFGNNCRGAVSWQDMIAKIEPTKLPSREWRVKDSSNCFECGKEWPHSLDTCPHCGNEIPF